MRTSQERTEAIAEHKIKDSQHSGLNRVIDLQLLYLIYKGPMSGYDLRRNMETRFRVKLSYGTIYPHLREFERKTLVLGSWSEATRSKKKIYTITQNGEAMLRESLSTLAIMNEELAV